MRARRARTSGINVSELPQQGKLDSVCAAVANALWISGDVRRDTTIHAVLEGPASGPKTITFSGKEIRGLRHDERSIATYISDALKKGAWLQLNEQMKVRAGITVAKKSFERLVWEVCSGRKAFVLDMHGKDVRKTDFPDDFAVIFGSAEGLPPKTERFLSGLKAEKVSLGPVTLFAAHCPIVVHNELDRRESVAKLES